MLFIIKGKTGLAPRQTDFHSGPFLQSNISILIAGNPVRSDNAWNEDHSENVYAQWRIVKLQAWDTVSSIYCLRYTAVVFSLVLKTEVEAIAIAVFGVQYFLSCPVIPLPNKVCGNIGIVDQSSSSTVVFLFYNWTKHLVTYFHFTYMYHKRVACLSRVMTDC